jgi:hypothetical protein
MASPSEARPIRRFLDGNKLVKRLGYSLKKAKKLLGKACPERRAQFVQQLAELLTQAQPDEGPLVVFADEATCIWTPTWAGAGRREGSDCM